MKKSLEIRFGRQKVRTEKQTYKRLRSCFVTANYDFYHHFNNLINHFCPKLDSTDLNDIQGY